MQIYVIYNSSLISTGYSSLVIHCMVKVHEFSCLEGNKKRVLCEWVASFWFSVAAEHKEICTESLTNLMQVFTLDYISLDNPLFGCESQGPQMCPALWNKAADIHMHLGKWNNEGPENVMPGSPGTEEGADWLAESQLCALTDDESRRTPYWTQSGMLPLMSPARLPWLEQD